MPRFRKRPVEVEATQWFEDGDHPAVIGGFVAGKQGAVRVDAGDFIIPELDGSGFYPCKADVFLATYAPAGAMTFGDALEALKLGQRVRRAGWNGKGMWLGMTCGSEIPAAVARTGAALMQVETEGVSVVSILPHIDMRAADGSIVIGWLASQTDMLASDWEIVS